jgi:predicted nucleic-acid-binding protein
VTSLDTNIVLRFLLDDVPEQTSRAKEIIINSPCYVTDVVVTEVVFVLERVVGMKRQDIARLIRKFLDLSTMVYNYYFLSQVIELYQAKPTLSFVDCYAAIEAKVYRNSLLTFDKQLAKHGGIHVKEA